ncbi:MAG: hypothetical protein NZ739_11755 [Verrucomicrobiae bacterium]|nr:hypothetical protein [Verrucomicrobiae bacterium]
MEAVFRLEPEVVYGINVVWKKMRRAFLAILPLVCVAHADGQELRVLALNVSRSSTHPPFVGAGYCVTQLNLGGAIEYRCYLHGHHFLSVINDGGAFVLRPHPGVDANGWGSSIYLQPFLAGPGVELARAEVDAVVPAGNGVLVSASGAVCAPFGMTYGTWQSSLLFRYDPTNKLVSGTGMYSIALSGPLPSAPGDLNVYKLASNFLTNVPVLSGGYGNTGDMSTVWVVGSNSVGPIAFEWDPVRLPAHCPSEQFSRVSVTVVGQYNEVDTAAQGFCPIQAACKPTVGIELASLTPDVPLIFCGFYALSEATNFAADNVGVNAVVLRTANQTNFVFEVGIHSAALPYDGAGVDAALKAVCTAAVPELAVFYAPTVNAPFRRLVGWLPGAGSNIYYGRVSVPFGPEYGGMYKEGYFRVALSPCR